MAHRCRILEIYDLFFPAKFFNLDISTVNSMTTDELKAKVEHEKLYDETDMAQVEGAIRSGIPKDTFLRSSSEFIENTSWIRE